MNPPTESTTVRHEEHLHVHTTTVPLESVQIEKVIVTERRTFTADVRREELRITRRPLTSSDPITPDSSGDPRTLPIVMVLREEQLVITTVLVPLERIVVDIAVISDAVHVAETLRREQIDLLEYEMPPGRLPRASGDSASG